LQGCVVVSQRALGEVESVAVRDAVAHINLAIASSNGDEKKETQAGYFTHSGSIRNFC
jgi:hypothetical protein